MKQSKQFYKDLPKHNGFKWFGFDYDDNFHHFSKEIRGKGFAHIKLLESDIEDQPNFKTMLEMGLTRS